MTSFSYTARLGFFLLLLSLIALYDLFRNRSAARRWREYLFLLLGGILGALFGVFNDFVITSRISPDYFILGKGIAGGPGFYGRVGLLGLQAGVGPGIIGAAVFVYVNSRRSGRPSVPFSALALHLAKPAFGAALLGLLLPLCFAAADPLRFRSTLDGLLTPDEVRRFLRVWWIHMGIYGGLVAGLSWGGVVIHRQRSRLDLNTNSLPAASPER